jgi:predicted transposase/invertase (TIGR01784 family)
LVFKRIFGEHPEILRSFLNAVLPFEREDEMIVSLTYLPSEQVPVLPVLKNTIVDVRCVDAAGRQFIVEMQMSWTAAFLQRMLFNASKAYVRQLEQREEYDLLQPVIGLALLDDTFDKGPDYYHHYRVVNVERPGQVIEGLQLVFVELPKYKEAHPATSRRLRWAWLRFLRETGDAGTPGHPTGEELRSELGLTPELNQALEMAGESAFSHAELEAYDRFWDSVRVERTLLSGARRDGMEIGKKLGIEEGKRIALDAALARMLEAGMAEAEARRLLGLDLG